MLNSIDRKLWLQGGNCCIVYMLKTWLYDDENIISMMKILCQSSKKNFFLVALQVCNNYCKHDTDSKMLILLKINYVKILFRAELNLHTFINLLIFCVSELKICFIRVILICLFIYIWNTNAKCNSYFFLLQKAYSKFHVKPS